MKTDADCAQTDPTGPAQGEEGLHMAACHVFVPTPLPIIGRGAAWTAPAGVALAFASNGGDERTDEPGADRFSLNILDAEGEILLRLSSLCDDEVVAVWRNCAGKSGLPRLILREDGSLASVSNQLGPVVLGKSRQRRRHGQLNGRRPRFLVRRKTARLPARPQIHRGENEIIART